jgi:hypothetical protein
MPTHKSLTHREVKNSQCIILRMHENLLLAAIRKDHSLHPRHRVRNRYSHTRWAAHEHTRPPSKFMPHLIEHVWQIRTTILNAPAV